MIGIDDFAWRRNHGPCLDGLPRGGAVLPHVGSVAACASLGFLSIGVNLVLFILALRHFGSARSDASFSLAPFIGTVLAVLREPWARMSV